MRSTESTRFLLWAQNACRSILVIFKYRVALKSSKKWLMVFYIFRASGCRCIKSNEKILLPYLLHLRLSFLQQRFSRQFYGLHSDFTPWKTCKSCQPCWGSLHIYISKFQATIKCAPLSILISLVLFCSSSAIKQHLYF